VVLAEHPASRRLSALCTLAMLNAGVSVDDPPWSKRSITSAVSARRHDVLRRPAHHGAVRREPKKDLLTIRQNVKWLEAHSSPMPPVPRGRKGMWSYSLRNPVTISTRATTRTPVRPPGTQRGRTRGVEVSAATWRLAQEHWWTRSSRTDRGATHQRSPTAA